MSSPNPIKIRLSPLSRLYFTLDKEIALGGPVFLDEQRYGRFVRMHDIASQKRDLLIRNMLILDAVVMLVLFGKSLTIPVINVALNDIPAAREVLTFMASLTFQFAALAFLNWHGYAAIVDMINVHKLREIPVDPDLVTAADKFLEFAVKLYRTKMNIRGIDFATPSKFYDAVAWLVMRLILISVASFLCLHLTVVFVSGRETWLTMPHGILLYVYLVFLLFANLGGLLVWVTTNKSFEFTVTLSPPQSPTPANPPHGLQSL